MAQNLKMDPANKDYVILNGSPVASNTVHEDCYFALTVPAGKWLHGVPGQGSELYRLQGTKRTAQTDQLFAQYAHDAIQSQVIDPGKANSVSIRTTDSARPLTSNQIDVVSTVASLTSQLNFRPV